MLHRVKSVDRYRGTLELLEETGLDLVKAAATGQFGSAKHAVASLNGKHPGFGTWLSRKWKAIIGPVQVLMDVHSHDPTVLPRLIAALEHDLDFVNTDQANFEFGTAKVSGQVSGKLLRAVRKLFLSLFDVLLGQGEFRIHRLGEADRYGKLELVTDFWRSQDNGFCVCPACDGHDVDKIGQKHEDLDHYLPKHKYPWLAVSPDLLVPVCTDCNTKFKGAHDPLEGTSVGGLNLICLPYGRPAVDLLKMDCDMNDAGLSPRVVRLVDKSGDPINAERVRRLDQCLQLSQRWQYRLDEKHYWSHVDNLLFQLRTSRPKRGWTKRSLRRKLQEWLRYIALHWVGRGAGLLVTRLYCEWLLENKLDNLLAEVNAIA